MGNDELMALILGLPKEPLAPTRVELPTPERQEADPFERLQEDIVNAAALNSWADAEYIDAQKAEAAPELNTEWDEVLTDERPSRVFDKRASFRKDSDKLLCPERNRRGRTRQGGMPHVLRLSDQRKFRT